jgi:adenosyl cobinamide kinase/adenosyl cobinamide phosphate guanylyltransferase
VIVLVLGGARSGKSAVAERLAATLPPPVTYVATLAVAGDPDLAARVARHRDRRPAGWATVEAGADLPALLRATGGTALVDSLGPWVAAAAGMAADVGGMADALRGRDGDSVVVSEEVGLGVHPATAAGRLFRDALGEANQAVAAIADEVLYVVAGRVLRPSPVDGPGGVLGRRGE